MDEQITEIVTDDHCFRLDSGKKALFTENGKPVHLTRQQFKLLKCLVEPPAYTLMDKDYLATKVWAKNGQIADESVHQAIKSLQKALNKEGGDFLKIVPGQGYRIEAKIRGRTEQATQSIPQSPEEAMAFLLFLDQFPVGVWGASLENAADLWGHKNDPGSITISTHASIGLTSATGSAHLPPITNYRKYLLSRRSKSGAFGMLKDVGSAWMPDLRVQEHARHTATALQFFHYYDGVEHPCVTDAVQYLLSPGSRTTSGYWADNREKPDTAADPVTVAFVVGALEGVYDALSNNDNYKEDVVPEISAVNEAIVIGLNYIHSTSLRTSEGMWHYKFNNESSYNRVMDNLYQYTADVLAQTSLSCIRLNMYLEETRAVVLRLKRIFKRYKGGLPQSPSHNTVHLETTATFIEAQWHLQETPELLENQFLDAYESARRRDVFELSTASGWSAFLMLSRHPFGSKLRIPPARAAELLKAAHEVALKEGASGSIPTLSAASESFICGLLRRRRARQPA